MLCLPTFKGITTSQPDRIKRLEWGVEQGGSGALCATRPRTTTPSAIRARNRRAQNAHTGAVMSAQICPVNNANTSVVLFDNDFHEGFSFYLVKIQRTVRITSRTGFTSQTRFRRTNGSLDRCKHTITGLPEIQPSESLADYIPWKCQYFRSCRNNRHVGPPKCLFGIRA